MLNTKIPRLTVLLALFSNAAMSSAETPRLANYSTSTSHNCIQYECKESLYSARTLDIQQQNISATQFQRLVEKHINQIQTRQTSYPGFNSTIKANIPKILKNNVLHCHKAAAQQINWTNSTQPITTVRYRHECWLYTVSQKTPDTARKVAIKQVDDIIYTIKISRKGTACASPRQTPHASNFECIAKVLPKKVVHPFRRYSLLPLDAFVDKNRVFANLLDENLHYVFFDVPDDFSFPATPQLSADVTDKEKPPLADIQPTSDTPLTAPIDAADNPIPEVAADDPSEVSHDDKQHDEAEHEEHHDELEHTDFDEHDDEDLHHDEHHEGRT